MKVLASYLLGRAPIGRWAVPLMGLSFLLAYLSYRWVEQPARRRTGLWAMNARRMILTSVVGCAVLASMTVPVLISGGWPDRLPADAVRLDAMRNQAVAYRACFGLGQATLGREECHLGTRGAPKRVLLIGDSHAAAIAPAFDQILRRRGMGGLVMPSRSCPPLLDAGNRKESKCFASNASAFKLASEDPAGRLGILHAFWVSYTGRDPQNADIQKIIFRRRGDGRASDLAIGPDLTDTVAYLVGRGKQVLVVGPMTESPMSPTEIAFAMLGKRPLSPPYQRVEFDSRSADRFNTLLPALQVAGAQVLLPAAALCRSGTCEYFRDGYPLFRDRNHLSLKGAGYFAQYLDTKLASLFPSVRDGAPVPASAN